MPYTRKQLLLSLSLYDFKENFICSGVSGLAEYLKTTIVMHGGKMMWHDKKTHLTKLYASNVKVNNGNVSEVLSSHKSSTISTSSFRCKK